ncbi:hypothetical protein H4R20_003059 [Coemansia guatemalensis]|uniref:Uncharacterized protein n=1 Tax=Coemansia guatemalensis TaxID=2761395 RepID=A0A9W8I0B9_9FUNG|nr:hypothetical protein H4R20_003059 [Coemansia guatemalensis]
MRFFAVISLALSVAVAQEIGATGDSKVASGVSAIDNPNVNNGFQADSSLFAGGNGANEGNLFNNVVNGHFANVNSNLAVEDNLVNNAGVSKVAGNSGWTANGDNNALGAVQNDFGIPFAKRGSEADYSNNQYHAAAPVYNAPAYKAPAVYHPTVPYVTIPVVIPAPVHYYAPVFHTKPAPVSYKAPVAEKPAYHSAPDYAAPSAPVVEKKAEQKATIIQNQA